MASPSQGRAERDRLAKESLAVVKDLSASLPKEVVQKIYADVVAELAAKAGLGRRPEKTKKDK